MEDLSASVLVVALSQTAHVDGSAELVLVISAGVELVVSQTAQVDGSAELVLVILAGVLLVALSHSPHVVVLSAVATAGVGYPIAMLAVLVTQFKNYSHHLQTGGP